MNSKIFIRITKTNIVFSDYYKPYFTNKSVKIPLNSIVGIKVHLAKMAPRRKGVCRLSRDRLLRGGVAVKDLKGPDKHNVILGLLI